MRPVPYLLPGRSVALHLAIESLLLEVEAFPGPVLLLYINDRSVIVGRNQNPWREVAPGCAAPVYRRISGGGSVFHDIGNLNWSLIVPRASHDPDAELAMMAKAVSTCGVPVEPGERGGLYCAASTGHGGRKVSGTARRIGSRRVLHHGTLLVTTNLADMAACLGGAPGIEDHAVASVPARVINLADVGSGMSTGVLVQAICRSVAGAPPVPFPLATLQAGPLEAETARFASEAWIYGSTPPFVQTVQTAGHVARILVTDGRVQDLQILPADIDAHRLIGVRYDGRLADQVLRLLSGIESGTNRN